MSGDSRKSGAPLSLDELAKVLRARGMRTSVTGESIRVTDITVDSRQATSGWVFAAVRGENAHGASFAVKALEAGCSAVLTDPEGEEILVAAGHADTPRIVVPDPRAAAARAAHELYEHPSDTLSVVGVTGTNGKTSVTTMLANTLHHLEVGVGVVGTNGTFLLPARGETARIPTERTTPEATDLHRLLARMAREGMSCAALEVSSHAMVLHRADAVHFRVAVFTNLSQDHLDFHSSMREYFEAKASLFTPEHAERGIVCVDDEWGRELARTAAIPVVTYSVSGAEADYRVVAIKPQTFGTRFEVEGPDGHRFALDAALPGRHYVANTLAVALILEALGYVVEDYAGALAKAGVVAGRMELVSGPGEPRVVVDYSHTPDALDKTLDTLRNLEGVHRVVTVMGAGGKRDATKRPLMGKAAAEGSDLVFVTDDNPRGEDPAAIRDQIVAGIPGNYTGGVRNVADRAVAISEAIHLAGVDDVVLIAGKGAEVGQDFGDYIQHFDDREQARRALATWARAHKGESCGQ